MNRVVIIAAKRTPFGRFRGSLASHSPVDLGVIAGEAALQGISKEFVDQVIIGNVFGAGHGMNVARQIGVHLGLPIETPATTINQMCGSGMQAALMGVTAIRADEAGVVLVGGTESMSRTKLLVDRPGKGQAPDPTTAVDTMLRDGLIDSFSGRHMGQQAEDLADAFGISREDQDAFAVRSQTLCELARGRGWFADELAQVGEVRGDEHPRPACTRDDLGTLKPAFREAGTVTAGNASGVNDGAAMLLLADRDLAIRQGWPMLAEWVDGLGVGCDPEWMGLGPARAIRELFSRSGCNWSDFDTLEINEAFAAQVLACLRDLELTLDPSPHEPLARGTDDHPVRFNAAGGAIAIGHPLAVSGARLLCHLAWDIHRGRARSAIGSLCIGGGMGIATWLRQPG